MSLDFKKYKFIAIIAMSFFLFACASTDSDNPAENENLIEPEFSTEIIEEESTIPSEDETELKEEFKAEETENITVETENDNKDAQTPDIFAELEEIEEPLVRDLFPEEEAETQNDDNESDLPEELVQVENLEPIQNENEVEDITVIPEISEDDVSENQNTYETIDNSTEESDEPNSTDIFVDFTEPETDENLESEENTETENDNDEETEDEEPELEEEIPSAPVIVPSRKVSLKRNETLIITYPGSNWIYMGSLDEFNNMANKGRKLGSTDTKYTLMAKNAGTQIHHFYKEDNLTGNYIDDYIEITVLDQKGNSKTVIYAPEYGSIIPPQPENSKTADTIETINKTGRIPQSATTKKTKSEDPTENAEEPKIQQKDKTTESIFSEDNSSTKTNTSDFEDYSPALNNTYNYSEDQSSDDDIMFILEPADIDTDALLNEAQNCFNSKDYKKALADLEEFFEYSTTRRDEALYLQGQIYEQDSNFKDIKAAVNLYQLLIDNFPASSYWNQANKRIIYLKRFYIEVR